MAAKTHALYRQPPRAVHAHIELAVHTLAAMIPPRGAGGQNINAAAITGNLVFAVARIPSRLEARVLLHKQLRRTADDGIVGRRRAVVSIQLQFVVAAVSEAYAAHTVMPVTGITACGTAPKIRILSTGEKIAAGSVDPFLAEVTEEAGFEVWKRKARLLFLC
jgi:hypothetical protein